jgi:outer membrane immunogenic protein
VNFGASFGHVKTDFNPVTLTATVSTFTDTFTTPGGFNILNPSGFIGGGQIGYNWQLSPIWVVGLEADFQGALEREHGMFANSFSGLASPNFFPVTGTTAVAYETKIDWFGTVRGRVGYVWGDGRVLSYVTGGLAYAKVDLEGTSTVSGKVDLANFSSTHAIGHSHVNAGWTVGYGMEGALAIPGWTWKIESLYMDLGHLDDTDRLGCSTGCTVSVGQNITHTHFIDGILRGGLNYQFH